MRMPVLALALTGALLSSGAAMAQETPARSSGGANGKSESGTPAYGATSAPAPETPREPARTSGGANGKSEVETPAAAPDQGAAEQTSPVPTTPRVPATSSGGANGKSEEPLPAATPPASQAPATQGMKTPAAPRAHKRLAARHAGSCRSAALAFDRTQQMPSVSASALGQATQMRNEGMTDCNAGNSKAGIAKLMQATRSLTGGA